MKKIYFILLIFGILLSCTDDLNVVPKDKDETTPNLVYNSLDGYKAVLAKLYAGFAVTGQQGPAGNSDIEGIDEGFGQYIRGYWHHQQLTTDEAVVGWNDRTIKDFHHLSWGTSDVFVYAFYSRIFYQVAQCNEFIRECADDKVSERGLSSSASTIAEYKAEARFIRALCYWHAIDVFGGNVPFATEESVLGEHPDPTTASDLFSYIESELIAIESDLATARSNEYARADQGSAWILLAKLYLNAKEYTGTEKYSEALTYAKKVIDAGYVLETDYTNLFKADNHTSDGIIFPIAFDGLRTRTWGGTTYLIHAAIGGSMNAADFGVADGWAGLRTTSKLVGLFPDPTPVIPTPATIANSYPKLYVPGDYQGWTPATANQLLSVSSDGNYEGYFNIPAGGTRQFKITTNPDWSVNYGDNGADLSLESSGANIVAAADGYYKFNVDTNAWTYTLTATTWGVIGDATPGGWSTDTDMTYDATNKIWHVTLDLIGGKQYKFRANDDWTINLGDNGADGTLEYGGANISVAVDGNYSIALKLEAPVYTYAINMNNPADSRYLFHSDGQNLVVADVGVFSDGYGVTKWTNKTSTGVNGSDETFPDTDFPMFRLADAYLMYAEAHLRGGGGSATDALNYVNNVRNRAGAGAITTAELDLDFILDERGRELYWEGHRRTDLRRFGKFTTSSYLWDWKGGVASGQAVGDHRNIFPIPTQDLNANPKLNQNQGY